MNARTPIEVHMIEALEKSGYSVIEPGAGNVIAWLEERGYTVVEPGSRELTIPQIQKRVSEHFGCSVAEMASERRNRASLHPRMVAMFLARQLTNHTLVAIGEAFGGRDHGTVRNAIDTIRLRMAADDQQLRDAVSILLHDLEAAA